MTKISRRSIIALASAAGLSAPAIAQKKSEPGITDTEILIGQTMPYSGPASSYSPIGRSQAAYFQMVHDEGGINGRKIRLLSLDDGYSPPKTVEQTRRLVEQDGVSFIFQQLGTPTSTSTRKYLNSRKVPQIFIASGATQFGDYEHFPWSIGWQPSYQIESRIFAKYVLKTKPDAKIGVLHQNDDSGRDYLKGWKDGLGAAGDRLVAVTTFEVTDPSIDSQIVDLQRSGADTFFYCGIPKFSALAIRKVHDLGWRPLFVLANVASSVAGAIVPAGPEKAVGIITTAYMKDPSDPSWGDDQGFKDWLAFMRKYQPDGDLADINNVYGYSAAQTLIPVLRQCGQDLSRENIMRQALSLDIQLPMFQAGIRFQTGPTDYYGIKRLRMQRFDGKAWVPFGEAVSA